AWPLRNCRSRPCLSRVSSAPEATGGICHESQRTPQQGYGRAQNRARKPAEGAFQPAHAGRHSAIVQHQPVGQGAPRYRSRAYRDAPQGRGSSMSTATESTATETTATEAQSHAPAKRQRKLVGKVVSNKMDQSVVVRVERRVKHPLLGKFIVRSGKYKA